MSGTYFGGEVRGESVSDQHPVAKGITMANDVQISMRLPRELVDRAEALVPLVAQDPAYSAWRVTKAAVLRLALMEGLERLERRFTPRRRKTGK